MICRRLDGMPLAIELAAARVRGLDITEIARRLDDRFSLLTTGSPERGRRKDSLREVVAWSYDLLPEHDQCCFRRLGVFADGFTLDGAAVVIGGDAAGGICGSGMNVSSGLRRHPADDSPSTRTASRWRPRHDIVTKDMVTRRSSNGERGHRTRDAATSMPAVIAPLTPLLPRIGREPRNPVPGRRGSGRRSSRTRRRKPDTSCDGDANQSSPASEGRPIQLHTNRATAQSRTARDGSVRARDRRLR